MTAAVTPADTGPLRLRATLALCRFAALATAIGAATMPPVASAAGAIMLLSFLALPDAGARLRRVLAEPLGRGWCLWAAALVVAGGWGILQNGLATGARALYDWRHLLLVPVGLAVFDTPGARRRFALGFIAFAVVGAVASMVALHQGVAFKATQQPGVMLRNPVTQALVLAVGAFLAIVLVATREVTAGWLRGLLAVVALALAANLLFLQTGRSGQVAFGVMLAVAVVRLAPARRRWAAAAAVLAIAVGAWFASTTLQQRFSLALDELRNAAAQSSITSMGIRAVMWQNTVELIGARPALGYGLGGLTPAYAALTQARYGAAAAEPSSHWKATPTTDPHNQYLQLWVEAGLPGLLAFLLYLFATARQPAREPYRTCGLALLAAWCVTSLFSSHFLNFNEGNLIAVFAGVLLARDG